MRKLNRETVLAAIVEFVTKHFPEVPAGEIERRNFEDGAVVGGVEYHFVKGWTINEWLFRGGRWLGCKRGDHDGSKRR